MKFTSKVQNKLIYSPISPECSPISAEEDSSSHSRRKKDKKDKKRVDDREYSRRLNKKHRYDRSRDRYDREDRSRVRNDRSDKYDNKSEKSRHKSHHKHDRHRSESRKSHKKSDRLKTRSKKETKKKHKKHEKRRHRSTSKSSSSSSSDSDDELNSSSFISEILKNKKTKSSEQDLVELKKTINNELNDQNISYTPPLKPGLFMTEKRRNSDAETKNLSDLKKTVNKKVNKSNGSKLILDENGNLQKVKTYSEDQVNHLQNDLKNIKVNHQTESVKSNDQKNLVSHGSNSKKKSVLELPMPPQIDISVKTSNNNPQKSHPAVNKPSNSIIVSIPLNQILESNSIEPIIAANFENSQLKRGIASHPPEPTVKQSKDKQLLPTDHGDHFKEMQKHLLKGAIFTPFDPRGTPPEYQKPARPSIICQPALTIARFQNQLFENFKILEQVGKGTYGKVFKAIDLLTKETVAMKYIKVEHETEGFPITCLREIKILRQLDHPNIIKLRDIVFRHEKNSTYLVFDYMNHDLLGLRINKEMNFDEANIYVIVKQLLEGINYCHQNKIIHRDLKLSNILVNNKGQVKICDFGLSRIWTENRPYTNKVISLWYRPIELLLGEEIYGPPVDIWSLGCIIFELFKRRPLFEFSTELEIVNGIFQLCGTPEYNMWPEVKKLPKYKLFKPCPRMRILKNSLFPTLPPSAIDLVDQMLALNPDRRITAEDALKSNWVSKMELTDKVPLVLPKVDSFEMRARGFL